VPTLTAQVGDTVSYRNADGETFNVDVTGAQRAAPIGADFTVTPSASGGTLATATYSYKVTAVVDGVETAPSVTETAAVTGPTGSVTVNATVLLASFPTATAWKVYGRVGGSELLIATITAPTATYVDTGAVTPAGAQPAANGAIRLRNRSTRETLAQIPKATGMKQTGVYFKR